MKAAAFIDAGYLYEMCAEAAFGKSLPRTAYRLDISAALEAITRLVEGLDGGGLNIIRIYWYDAVNPFGRSHNRDHSQLAKCDNVKLRLGDLMQRRGGGWEQKGVDALIIHDICELAQRQAIDTALLVSGDSDLVLGVTTAQTYGVRVHLLGMGRGHTAEKLRHESDAFHEWDPSHFKTWASAADDGVMRSKRKDVGPPRPHGHATIPLDRMLVIADAVLSELNLSYEAILNKYESSDEYPVDLERVLMKTIQRELGREVTLREKIGMRDAFFGALRTMRDAEASVERV